MKKCGVIILFSVLLVSSVFSTAMAESICDAEYKPISTTIWVTLKKKNDQDCYINYVNNYKGAFGIDKAAKSDAERRDKTILSWKLLRDRAKSETIGSHAGISKYLTSVSMRAQNASDDVSASSPTETVSGVAGSSAWEIKWGLGILPTSSSEAKDRIELKKIIISACIDEIVNLQNGSAQQCRSTYEASEKLIKVILVGNSIGKYYGRKLISDLASDVNKVNKEWDSFLFKSKPMYPLDLIATDFMYRKFGEYDRSAEGFKRPPKYQWFFLHPSPAFEYVSNAMDGEQLKPTVYLEIFGVNAWKNRHFTGISLIATYTDRNNIDDKGFGVLITYKNSYSLAITKYGDETGVMFGLDIARFFTGSLKSTLNSIR